MKADLELKNTRLLQFMVDDQYRVFRHIALLLASLSVIFYSNWQTEYHGADKYYRVLCVYGLMIIMCYINMLVLVPMFFFKARYLLYLALLSLSAILCQYLMDTVLHNYLSSAITIQHSIQHHDNRGSYEGFIMVTLIILLTTMIKLFQRWIRDNGRIAELQNIALRTELNELKNQISPHFLFNMLNGIKALIRTNPEKATLIIMKLSEFLRYQLYENNQERTLLKSEITFLSNFLNLEMIRRDNLSIDIYTHEIPETLNGTFLPPNLFTIFVENAVKHSVDICGAASYVKISFSVVNDQLTFYCRNSKDPKFVATEKKNSGMGLNNIKRRLTLLYDQDYALDVQCTANQFQVTLKLPL
jgi:sensor histidine kinase YesM